MDRKLSVVYIAHGMYSYGGAALSLYNLISSVIEFVKPIVISCEEGPMLSKLRYMGIRCIVMDFRILLLPQFGMRDYHKKFPYLFAHYLWHENRLANETVRILQGEHVDIVHSNSSAFSFGYTLSRKLKAKHVWHIREFGDLDFNYEIFGGRRRLTSLINKADARIAISSAVAKHWHLKDRMIFILGNSVRRNRYNAVRSNKSSNFLFCVAYITHKKRSTGETYKYPLGDALIHERIFLSEIVSCGSYNCDIYLFQNQTGVFIKAENCARMYLQGHVKDYGEIFQHEYNEFLRLEKYVN